MQVDLFCALLCIYCQKIPGHGRHATSSLWTPSYLLDYVESTPLSCSLADQGIKIRIRKDIRIRKRPFQVFDPLPQPLDSPTDERDGDRDNDEREADRDGHRPIVKRSRTEANSESSGGAALSSHHPWPPQPA